MRILLAHNSTYFPSHGGGDKSNRLLMKALVSRGHQVHVGARVDHFGRAAHEKLLDDLRARGVTPNQESNGIVRFELDGADVFTLSLDGNVRQFFKNLAEDFDPDIILTSTDDPGQLLLDVALRTDRARVVYLVRATIAVPFGPDSSMLSTAKTETLRHVDACVGVSHYVAGYVRQHAGIEAVHVPISLLEGTDFPQLGSFDNRYVVLVNPCLVKGISIFLALADELPDQQFAAVPTWGTTHEDYLALKARKNVTIIPPVDRIDALLRQTKVTLVPSVWAEARSRMVLESMAYGVPVISADVGGLHEAHLGVPYLLPVNPVRNYRPSLDESMVPVAEVPPQDIGPWKAALSRLCTDREHYEQLSQQGRRAALAYAQGLTAEPLEAVLEDTLKRPKKGLPATAASPLSMDRRKLLALRLKQRHAPDDGTRWFAGTEHLAGGKPLLICLPWAGGGTAEYRGWSALLPAVNVIAVRLPARETRASEAPFVRMQDLVEALGPEIARLATGPFALFGHSMGGAIAFELTRWLRRYGHALPSELIVSSTRAPQLRRQPDLKVWSSDAEMLDEVMSRGGLPVSVAQNPELLNLLLPALRADLTLYKQYVYSEESPLPVPVTVYGGENDGSVPEAYLASWLEQTDRAFTLKRFSGGHFFFSEASRGLFLRDLNEALMPVSPDRSVPTPLR